MDSQILQELETAAQILLAPPNLVNNDQRHAAESVFLNLRKTKTPYVMCKQILETSRVDYVLFEVAGLIKTALIKEWVFLQETDRTSLREYLFNYVVERSTLPAFVRERVLQVVAIMVKRESVDDLGTSRGQLLTQVESLVLNGDHSRQILGCNMMAALMQEYGITFKSSDVGLPWEQHFKAKKMFEATDMKRIFQFCCRALNDLTSSESPLNQQGTALLKALLALSESVLSWSFVLGALHKRLIGMFEASYETDQNSSLRLGADWREVMLQPQLVDMFYTVYWKIRMNPQLAHHGMTCLVQLASLNGGVFANKETRLQYIVNYLQNFIKLVTSVQILDREALGVSNVICKVLLYFPPCMLAGLPSDVMQNFLQVFTKLTCEFAEGAAAEESICAEDRLYMEGFDRVMEAWLMIFLATDTVSPDLQSTVAQQVFNVYVKLHMAPPDGTRGCGRELETEEMDESDEPDRVRFRGQLQTVGVMGRIIPQHSLPLLSKLLEERTRKLSAVLEKLHQQAVTIADNNAIVLLFEDIHWLLLIAGYVTSMHSDGETSTVPMELMTYSIKQAAHIDTSMQVFGSPHLDIQAVPNGEQHTDHVLRIVAATFRLSNVLNKSMEAKLVHLLSPEVASSLLWFLQRWSATYLLLDEELYTDLSFALLSAHGRDSDGGVWALRFLIDQVLTHILHFHSEPAVVQDAVALLLTFVNSRDKRNVVVKSEGLGKLLQLLPRLPLFVKRGIFKSLATMGMAVHEGSSEPEYWDRVLRPLQERFKTLVLREDSSRTYQEESVKTELLDITECLIGVCGGAHSSTVQTLFSYLQPFLSEIPALLGVYHNYQAVVESVLTLLCEVARFLVPYLTRTEVRRFYEVCLHTIQTYAKWNSCRLSLESEAQDETFQDVLLLLELLTNLLSKDMLDLAPAEPGAEEESIVTASDVCLSGLNLIMPLMTLELLKYPTLCLSYYKLLAFLTDTFPEKVLNLPENLLKSVLHSVEAGLTSFGHDIVIPCCDFLLFLATHVANQAAAGAEASQVLRPFCKINSDSAPNASPALLALICCYQQDYTDLVRELLASQPDQAIAERLARAFTDLTAGVELTPTRISRHRFRTNFEKFIVEVHGFLHYK